MGDIWQEEVWAAERVGVVGDEAWTVARRIVVNRGGVNCRTEAEAAEANAADATVKYSAGTMAELEQSARQAAKELGIELGAPRRTGPGHTATAQPLGYVEPDDPHAPDHVPTEQEEAAAAAEPPLKFEDDEHSFSVVLGPDDVPTRLDVSLLNAHIAALKKQVRTLKLENEKLLQSRALCQVALRRAAYELDN